MPVLVIVAWFLAHSFSLLPDYLLPSPAATFENILEGFASGELTAHTVATIRRVMLGVLIASILALPIGLALGFSRSAYLHTSSTINAFRSLPPVALIPLAIVWFGIGDAPALFLIAFASYWPILLNTTAAVQEVDPLLHETALTMGADREQLMMTVLIPAALPRMVAGIRIALGVGWGTSVTAELLAVKNGLGFFIWSGRLLFRMEDILAGISVIAVLGVILDWGMRRLQQAAFPGLQTEISA